MREAHHVLSILPDSLPTVLVGDLNATPRAGSIRALVERRLRRRVAGGGASGRARLHVPGQRPAPPDRLRDGPRASRACDRRGVGAGRPRRGDERPVRPSPVARPARAAGTVAGLACGGDQRHPRRRPAGLRTGRRDRAAGRRRRCATEPADRLRLHQPRPVGGPPRPGLRHAGRVLLQADGGEAALRRPRLARPDRVHGAAGRDGGDVGRAGLEGDAQLGPGGARGPSAALRLHAPLRPAGAARGRGARHHQGAQRVPRPHRRAAAALPPRHRRRHRLPRDVLRPDAPPRAAPHPGHPLPGHGPGPGRGARVGGRARRHQPDHRPAPGQRARPAGPDRRRAGSTPWPPRARSSSTPA